MRSEGSVDRHETFSAWRRFADRTKEILRRTRSVTDEEVRSIGSIIDRIIRTSNDRTRLVKQTIEETQGRFQGLSRQMGDLADELQAQRSRIRDAQACANSLAGMGKSIHSLGLQTRLLAINAKIEAARLGEHGRPLQALAEQTNVLNQEVKSMSHSISVLTQELRRLLPALEEQNDRIRGNFSDFQGAVEEMVEASPVASDEHIEQVMSWGYEALSHLQFQDPMIQELEEIDGEVRKFAGYLSETIDLEIPDSIPVHVEKMSIYDESLQDEDEDVANPGDILLF